MTDAGRYHLDNRIIDEKTPGFEAMLRHAHAVRSRPVCLCTPDRPEMYLCAAGGRVFMKRMPGTGHLHDPSCVSFDAPETLTGRGRFANGAISPDGDGGTRLMLDVPLSVRAAKAAEDDQEEGGQEDEDAGPDAGGAIKSRTRKLGLLGLLHYLWDEADLTKHRPDWTGKRSWSLVHRRLEEAGMRASLRGKPLSNHLFVPPPFRAEMKDDLDRERARFMAGLAARPGRSAALGIVVGTLKRVDETALGRKIVLKHLPEFPLHCDTSMAGRFVDRFGDQIAMADSVPDGHFVVIATFLPKGNHGVIRTISGMGVTRQWIPFEDHEEVLLIKAQMSRSFTKCLHYDLGRQAPMASALLLDTDGPVAVFSPPAPLSDTTVRAFEDAAGAGPLQSVVWQAGQTVQADLPPRRAGYRTA